MTGTPTKSKLQKHVSFKLDDDTRTTPTAEAFLPDAKEEPACTAPEEEQTCRAPVQDTQENVADSEV